jgi:hypothetical protein
VRVTHPFHPFAGRTFDLVVRKHNWSEDRVFVFTDEGDLTSIPAGWTDVDPPDPFDVVSAGRSAFRVADLLALASLLDGLLAARRPRRVRRTSP